jgi:hypothetical protein
MVKLAIPKSFFADKPNDKVALHARQFTHQALRAWAQGRHGWGEGTGGPIWMARPQLILPRADSGCGKVFYHDRRIADGHRIALEFWNQATGRGRGGYRLAVYRCKRCGGFHIGQKRIPSLRARTDPGSVCHDENAEPSG